MNRKLLTLAFLIPLVGQARAWATPEWTRQLGTTATDISRDVAADGLGSVFITGETLGNLGGPNAGSFDPFVAKYDDTGNLLWTRQFGTTKSETAESISTDGLGNAYIAGGQNGLFVAKYDGAGNLEWTREAPGYALGVAADGLGSVYVGGYRSGPGGNDAFLTKYDDAGTFQWTQQLGTTDYDIGWRIAADGLGNVYLAGQTTGSLGGPNAGGYDSFIAKYDGTGALEWTRQFGTSAGDFARNVAVDGLGNAYIVGSTTGSLAGPLAGTTDVFVAKYDATGNVEWSRQFGSGALAGDSGNDISADQFGNIYVASRLAFVGPALTKFDADGNFQGTTILDSGLYYGVSADGTGDVYLSGYVEPNNYDAILVKFTEAIVPEPASILLVATQLVLVGVSLGRRELREN
ncbi:MAG: SBBP repeat-containing protein [Pirellulales bacterium]